MYANDPIKLHLIKRRISFILTFPLLKQNFISPKSFTLKKKQQQKTRRIKLLLYFILQTLYLGSDSKWSEAQDYVKRMTEA